jgi:LmbE family N-acetylglucosaminyl deacetylase
MLRLNVSGIDKELKILCIGAHSDDIEIGCGGSILRLLKEHPHSHVYWIVFSADRNRAIEARQSADLFLAEAKQKTVVIKEFHDSFFPYVGGEIKEYFRTLVKICEPDLIFTHYRHDLHQDHRLLAELTWNTFRNHLILEYEIPKWDGDLGQPNFFIDIEKRILEKKISIIIETFQSQKKREWFTQDIFTSLMRLRGMESKSLSHYAEAFYCRKILI